jgi:hypothetical protein
MAYDAIRDTHSSRSPSTTPVLDTHYPFPPGQSMNAPGRNGASPHYQEMSSPYERQPYPGQFERQASSRPGSSGGLRGLLNDEEEPGIFPERRSSGSTQGQIPSHRREYRHPSIGSVLGGAGSPGSMGEGRSLSMLLNGPTTLATPSSTTAMTPGMTPSHYPSPSPLGSNIRSPRFAVPTSAGGQTREYPFPPTPSGSSQHTSRPSPALYGTTRRNHRPIDLGLSHLLLWIHRLVSLYRVIGLHHEVHQAKLLRLPPRSHLYITSSPRLRKTNLTDHRAPRLGHCTG